MDDFKDLEEKADNAVDDSIADIKEEAADTVSDIKEEAADSVTDIKAEAVKGKTIDELEAAEVGMEEMAALDAATKASQARNQTSKAAKQIQNEAAPKPAETKPGLTEAKPKQTETKTKQTDKKQSAGLFARFQKGVKEVISEFKKIVWPNRQELTKMTITVIITSLLFGVLIAGYDVVFGFVVGILVDLV